MQSQHSSCGIKRPQLAIVQAILQVPIIQLLLQHYKDDGQELSGSGTDGLA
jgi:hypothetical protein